MVDFWSLAVILNELGVVFGEKLVDWGAPFPGICNTPTRSLQSRNAGESGGERLWGYWKEQWAGRYPARSADTGRDRRSNVSWSAPTLSFEAMN